MVDSEAREDVVGISKRTLETLVEELPTAEEPVGSGAGEAKAPVEEEVPAAEPQQPSAALRAAETPDPQLSRCIEVLQKELGPRIERILGTGGRLLVVVDRVEETAAQPVPAGPSPLLLQARGRPRAAELLVEQELHRVSAGVAALCHADCSGGFGWAETRALGAESGVWLHGEVLPKGLLGQGNGLMRALALTLAQAPELPEALVLGVLEDARGLVAAGGVVD